MTVLTSSSQRLARQLPWLSWHECRRDERWRGPCAGWRRPWSSSHPQRWPGPSPSYAPVGKTKPKGCSTQTVSQTAASLILTKPHKSSHQQKGFNSVIKRKYRDSGDLSSSDCCDLVQWIYTYGSNVANLTNTQIRKVAVEAWDETLQFWWAWLDQWAEWPSWAPPPGNRHGGVNSV